MLAILGVLGTILGMAIAFFAPQLSSRQPMIAKLGGGIFVAGLALLGIAFPIL